MLRPRKVKYQGGYLHWNVEYHILHGHSFTLRLSSND